MKDVSIELVVFGVLILVIVLDLLIKGRKKKQDIQDESNLIKGKETTDAKKSSSVKRLFNYFIERPKNIALYLVSIIIVKILIHFFAYRSSGNVLDSWNYKFYLKANKYNYNGDPLDLQHYQKYQQQAEKKARESATSFEELSFSYHVENVFVEEVFLFLYSFVLVSFLAWQFNSYLKKR